jgi:amylosucrase
MELQTDMYDHSWLERQCQLTYRRLMPRLETQGADGDAPAIRADVRRRLDQHFELLFRLLFQLYGDRYDFLYHFEQILLTLLRSAQARPSDLCDLDTRREAEPDWFQQPAMLGGVCYVDRFGGNLQGIRKQTDYFCELGLTYLHLMPLFAAPAGDNDGGYAVSDYRTVAPELGDMAELEALAGELRRKGMSLVLDFVFNHSSNEHRWARRALAGETDYQEFYYMFPDRTLPDAYEQTLREIFPDEHAGAFIYEPGIERWIWSTFHSYQWDLNYRNPAVFTAMLDEMLYLANLGVEVLRLDAIAFIWKEMGTTCENLPEAHTLVQAFNACARIAAPALLFKSEAIVHPDYVIKYIAPHECQLSYNPLLMALLWNSLATREVGLLRHSMQRRLAIPERTAWVNYVRSHDDIGWTFSDEDAAELGINSFDHRRFLNDFYTGRFPGSFARGLPFQYNPRTGDLRVSGTTASLAGLEKALREETAAEVELAIRRILLVHAVIMSIGGIPLLYLGDEVGTLNDYNYAADPAHAADSRWLHRPVRDAPAYADRSDAQSIAGRIADGLRHLITLRQQTTALTGQDCEVLDAANGHVFAYLRRHNAERLLVLANFSEAPQSVSGNLLRLHGPGYQFRDLLSGQFYDPAHTLLLEAYQYVWMQPACQKTQASLQ